MCQPPHQVVGGGGVGLSQPKVVWDPAQSSLGVTLGAKCEPGRKRQGGFEAFPSRGVQKRGPFAPAARQMMPERGVQGQSTSKVMEINKINEINKTNGINKTNKSIR